MAETEKPKCFQKFSCYSSKTLYRHRKSTTHRFPANDFRHKGRAGKITPKKGASPLKKAKKYAFQAPFYHLICFQGIEIRLSHTILIP